jgi:hypothetical protein
MTNHINPATPDANVGIDTIVVELKEPFVYEFLLDAEDIILDFKFDAEREDYLS